MDKVNIHAPSVGADRQVGSAKLDLPTGEDSAYINKILLTTGEQEQFICGENFCAELVGVGESQTAVVAFVEVDGRKYVNFKNLLLTPVECIGAIVTNLNPQSSEYLRLSTSPAFPMKKDCKNYLAVSFLRSSFPTIHNTVQVAVALPDEIDDLMEAQIEDGFLRSNLGLFNMTHVARVEILPAERLRNADSSD